MFKIRCSKLVTVLYWIYFISTLCIKFLYSRINYGINRTDIRIVDFLVYNNDHKVASLAINKSWYKKYYYIRSLIKYQT